MATQQQISDWIRANYKIEGESQTDGFPLLIVNIEGVTKSRRQTVFIGIDSSIFCFSPFAGRGQVSADQVFKAHEGMRHGLALVGDHYCVVANLPIGDLDPSEIYVLVELTGKLADSMEKKLKLGDNI